MNRPKLKKDWVGLKVETLKTLRNGMIEIPAGTVCEVERNYGGLALKAQKCEKCGVSVFINKVPESWVVII